MALTPEDIETLRLLLREELTTREEFDAFANTVKEQHAATTEAIDGLYKLSETREQEYLVIKHQLEEVEKKLN